LWRYEVHSDDACGPVFHFLQVLGQFDTPAFAPAAGVDLGFDYMPASAGFPAELFGCIHSFLCVMSNKTALDIYAETGKYFLSLIFVKVHNDVGL
jgi:hypothetical protein